MSIKIIVLITILLSPFSCFSWRISQQKTFSIMLDPAGDAKHPGRIVRDSFERGITLQCAEQLKKMLEATYKNIRVVLTRFPGETIAPLQNANFSNRLHADFYLSINFYHGKEERPRMHLYYFIYHPVTDFWAQSVPLCFYSYEQAHLRNLKKTKHWGQIMLNTLSSDEHKRLFDCRGIYAIPFRPLIGIRAPALAIEVSLGEKTDWVRYVQAIVESLKPIIYEQLS